MKSVTMQMRWVFWLLFGMGLLFLGIGVIVGQLATGFDSMEDEHIFRVTFLATFGGMGLIMMLSGVIAGYRIRKKNAAANDLLSSGNNVWADVVDVSGSQNVRVNNQSPRILRCTYRHTDGNTYMFKSGYLRYDPRTLLKDGKVKVWFDPYDMKKYYVDVDGSLSENIVEL